MKIDKCKSQVVCVYVCVYMCVCVCVYERDRDKDRDRETERMLTDAHRWRTEKKFCSPPLWFST